MGHRLHSSRATEEIKDVEVISHGLIDPENPSLDYHTVRAYKGDLLLRMRASISRGRSGLVELSPDGTRVIKCILPDQTKYDKDVCLRNLVRECEVYYRLPPHKRILSFYGFTADRETASLTLEYMRNGDQLHYPKSHPERTTFQRVRWCAQATEGLMHLHSNKVTHSDPRQENMLMADDKTLRVIDFGGSAFDSQPSLVAEATRYFLPRENWDTNTTTDRFTLGSSFYYIMTGREPYHDLDRELVDEQFAKKAFPSDVHNLIIGEVIVKCWECKCKHTNDVYKDLYDLRDKIPRD